MPKFGKLNPLSGLARMFSVHSLMELGKACLKVLLLGCTLALLLQHNWPRLMMMNRVDPAVALAEALHMLAQAFVILGVC
jgi:flagellar biosynthetic protein FlhB